MARALTIAGPRSRIEVLEQEWRRALADTARLRRRLARHIAHTTERERAATARRWLPVVDDLDTALEHAEATPRKIADALRAVRDEVVRVLAELGFPRRDDRGEAFDPARHDAVGSGPGHGAQPGTVLRVVLPGYGSAEHQLRPALVVVADD
jgi:molecular chaperone GrpE